MWLSLVLIILIGAIAFFQATQGLFSALLMTVLTICCAALALGTHEYVAINYLASRWRPDFSFALALGLTFGISLLALRGIMDNLIRRSCLLPSWVDRVGGAICGLVTGMIVCGIAALCIQMVPFGGGSFLTYARVELPVKEQPEDATGDPVPPNPEHAESELWFTPDRFVIAMLGAFSDGVFSSNRSFKNENVDYVQALGWRNAVPLEVPRYAPPNSITVKPGETVGATYREVSMGRDNPNEYEIINPKEGHELRVYRIQLKKEAQGLAKSQLFTLRQIRLVGHEEDGTKLQFYATGIQQEKDFDATTHYVKVKRWRRNDWPVWDEVLTPREGNNNEIRIVFEVPKGFKPEYLEFKRGARAELASAKEDESASAEAEPAAPVKTAAATPKEGPKSGDIAQTTKGGGVRSFSASHWNFGETLPFTLKNYTQLKNAEISRGGMVNGHLVGNFEDQNTEKNPPVSKLIVPEDQKLLHLSANFLETKSTLGKALGFAVKSMQNYLVLDANGKAYQLVGKYAVADVDGQRVVEVQYFSEQAGSVGGVGQFSRIKESSLKGDYQLVFLFLVDPGAKIVSFSTSGGGADAGKQDLSEENIVAPK